MLPRTLALNAQYTHRVCIQLMTRRQRELVHQALLQHKSLPAQHECCRDSLPACNGI